MPVSGPNAGVKGDPNSPFNTFDSLRCLSPKGDAVTGNASSFSPSPNCHDVAAATSRKLSDVGDRSATSATPHHCACTGVLCEKAHRSRGPYLPFRGKAYSFPLHLLQDSTREGTETTYRTALLRSAQHRLLQRHRRSHAPSRVSAAAADGHHQHLHQQGDHATRLPQEQQQQKNTEPEEEEEAILAADLHLLERCHGVRWRYEPYSIRVVESGPTSQPPLSSSPAEPSYVTPKTNAIALDDKACGGGGLIPSAVTTGLTTTPHPSQASDDEKKGDDAEGNGATVNVAPHSVPVLRGVGGVGERDRGRPYLPATAVVQTREMMGSHPPPQPQVDYVAAYQYHTAAAGYVAPLTPSAHLTSAWFALAADRGLYADTSLHASMPLLSTTAAVAYGACPAVPTLSTSSTLPAGGVDRALRMGGCPFGPGHALPPTGTAFHAHSLLQRLPPPPPPPPATVPASSSTAPAAWVVGTPRRRDDAAGLADPCMGYPTGEGTPSSRRQPSSGPCLRYQFPPHSGSLLPESATGPVTAGEVQVPFEIPRPRGMAVGGNGRAAADRESGTLTGASEHNSSSGGSGSIQQQQQYQQSVLSSFQSLSHSSASSAPQVVLCQPIAATAARPGVSVSVATVPSGPSMESLGSLHRVVRETRCFKDIFTARAGFDAFNENGGNGGGVPASADAFLRYGRSRPVRAGCGGRPPTQQSVLFREAVYVYAVQHRCRRSCAASPYCFAPGTLVVMDGDMGVEMGVISAVVRREEYGTLSTAELTSRGLPSQLHDAFDVKIYRAATSEEEHLYNGPLRLLERRTLQYLRSLSENTSLEACRLEFMQFIGCELQADGQKVYVYYKALQPVRFLQLVTHLNHIFHCRIWMHEVVRDASKSTVSASTYAPPTAPSSLSTTVHSHSSNASMQQ